MMVNMQIREQLQWIANNFDLHVRKTSAANVDVVCLLQTGYKIGTFFSLCFGLHSGFDLVRRKGKDLMKKLDN